MTRIAAPRERRSCSIKKQKKKEKKLKVFKSHFQKKLTRRKGERKFLFRICQTRETIGGGGGGGGGYRSVMTAPLFGATKAGNAVPERAATASSSSPASSVVSNPPNIPNVVEYHLKVKPGQTQRISTTRIDNSSVSIDRLFL